MKYTLGITTYKRVDALEKLITQVVFSDLLSSLFDVLIVNDSGEQKISDSYDAMLKKYKEYNVKIEIHHNKHNLGLPLAFTELVKHVENPYFFFMADDDLILPDELESIIGFIDKKQPSLLTARWLYKDKRIGRGIYKTRKAEVSEFRLSSGHFSGIFFNTTQMKEAIPFVVKEIINRNAAVLTYPAVFYHIPIILKYNNSWWYDADIVIEGDALASTVKDHSGNSYSDKSSRFQQIAGFDSYILSFEPTKNRDLVLTESRAWSIMKAVSGGNQRLKKRILQLLKPSIWHRIRRKIIRLTN